MTLNSDNFSRILEVLSKMAEEAEGTNVSWPNVLNYPPGAGLGPSPRAPLTACIQLGSHDS